MLGQATRPNALTKHVSRCWPSNFLQPTARAEECAFLHTQQSRDVVEMAGNAFWFHSTLWEHRIFSSRVGWLCFFLGQAWPTGGNQPLTLGCPACSQLSRECIGRSTTRNSPIFFNRKVNTFLQSDGYSNSAQLVYFLPGYSNTGWFPTFFPIAIDAIPVVSKEQVLDFNDRIVCQAWWHLDRHASGFLWFSVSQGYRPSIAISYHH